MANLVVEEHHQGWQKNLQVDDVFYDLYIPSRSLVGTILVLPGWNFPRTSWVENSELVKYADEYGYALILPEMGQTIYESSYYPETTMKWNSLPGGEFIKTRLIPEMQTRHNLLQTVQYNTLLGLSTGGRGVTLIALENPQIFKAGASLSGDFSQENMPADNLMRAVYGPIEEFEARWRGRDNPQARIKEWSIPLYLTHGSADEIVPESQSRLFYDSYREYHRDTGLVVYYPVVDAGHDYTFWNSQLPNIFEFFEKFRGLIN
ncbi:alpha/beta hydrolase-fold protein [Gloeocapsa sp. PCC 73106]|uniref:alpha/beta hydrolase-fold protein n=1 Tax=Gloeocapsa sp. PCC 73106 TaxID=102232 RepID=UPI00031DA3CD|nr:alpha/beta hydrolase-fold protein [Gloeocapsa sp. PCC 73106]